MSQSRPGTISGGKEAGVIGRLPYGTPPPAELDHSPGANSTDPGTSPVPTFTSLTQFLMASTGPAFMCPGESHPIAYSVHLARLSTGYAACRHCEANIQSSQSSVATRPAIRESTANRTLVTSSGVRGIYLNELDRLRAADWGTAFASYHWDEQPRIGRSLAVPEPAIEEIPQANVVEQPANVTSTSLTKPSAPPHAPTRRGPTIVIGFDERPSSPDIVVGVAQGLRRMGCQVIDLGQTTRPCFHFAVHHLDAAGGIFVTGNGFDPAWTGFHFAGRSAIPWLDTQILRDLELRVHSSVARPTRAAGTQRPFHASVPYQAGLWKLFHALRPLHVVCGAATKQLPRILDGLFARLPCRLTHETLPVRRRDLSDPNDPDVRRVASAIQSGKNHLGLIIDDDGESCAFITERGHLVSAAELARMLIVSELHEHRSACIAVDKDLFAEVARLQTSSVSICQFEQVPVTQLPSKVLQAGISFGISADHRVWFNGAYPACNAIQTLARVLQALSLTDAPMSEVLQRIA